MRGWLAAWALFCVCCVGALCVRSCHGSGLVAVQRLGRQNAAQAVIAGAGNSAGASGEVRPLSKKGVVDGLVPKFELDTPRVNF